MAKKADLTTKVFDELRTLIRDFHLLPGVKVSDKEIAERMGISRTPVREALVRLEAVGLLDTLPNRGYRVRAFTVKDITDLYTLREALEVLAVRLATPNLNPARIKALQREVEIHPVAIKEGRLKDACRADDVFHDLIARYSDNDLLYKALRDLSDQIHIARRYDHIRLGTSEKVYTEHLKILDLMSSGEAELAAKEIAKHISESKESFEKQLR
jgi:DNA-binding GntR family transcriptional regulator